MIYNGDCLEIMPTLADNSVDAIVTDPPYGLSFMGKKWDYDVPSVEIWRECLRVLKHGGHLLSFAGTRTQHRMAVNIEDAGFEIRDMIAWVYGSGFPKSLNIGKAVDKLQGNERATVREYETHDIRSAGLMDRKPSLTVVETKGTSEFEGWGTALKPALEPITVARKPLEKGLTVAENCLKWGVGGINIDGCRVGTTEQDKYDLEQRQISKGSGVETNINFTGRDLDLKHGVQELGRFPANLIHDGSDEVVGLFPQTKSGSGIKKKATGTANGIFNINKIDGEYLNGDSGSAARFFYCAKASRSERNAGLEGISDTVTEHGARPCDWEKADWKQRNQNHHPTVKPIALMEYLVKLVSREGQTVLDPFAGSGTTGIACLNTGRKFILIEKDESYCEIIRNRIENHQPLLQVINQ